MKLRTTILLISSVPFFCFFVFGITELGQKFLQGDIPPGTDHWKADDIVMGAGLAPWIYGLIPFLFLCSLGLISWFFDQRTKSN